MFYNQHQILYSQISAILICLIALVCGAPQSFSRIYDGRTGNTIYTRYGSVQPSYYTYGQRQPSYNSYGNRQPSYSNFGYRQPLGQLEKSYESFSSPATTLPENNARTLEQENRFLPLMKALQNFMETNNPAPEDINTLLAYSKELKKDASKVA